MGLAEVLTVIFVCCKLFGVIAWSWWWVFSPLWIVYGGIALIIISLFVFALLFGSDFKFSWKLKR